MKAITLFVRTTILGGLFFLAPLVVLLVILSKAADYARTALNAVVVHVPAASEMSPGEATTASIIAVALLCFLAGLVSHTKFAESIVRVLESSLLSNIPGYDYLKQASASALGATEIEERPVVLVPMEGGWQIGIQVEALGGGLAAVFIPGAPNPNSGSLFFFPEAGLRPTGMRLAAALSCLRRCGAGAIALNANWPDPGGPKF